MTIGRFSGEPAYRQVAAILRDRIRAGQITARLPSAVDLKAEFGIAEFTAIKALRLPRAEGWSRTAMGLGSFVVPREDWPEG